MNLKEESLVEFSAVRQGRIRVVTRAALVPLWGESFYILNISREDKK